MRTFGTQMQTEAGVESRPLQASLLPSADFLPRRFVRGGNLQTLLARRQPAENLVRRLEQPMLLDAGPDESGVDPDKPVQMLGYYNAPLRPAIHKGLILLFHGWMGSSHSADVQYLAEAALRKGYSTFRINLRDHGPALHVNPYALNKGLFGGPYLHEVATVARTAALLAGDRPVYLVGGSLGGNFVLRLAALQGQDAIPNLAQTIAICPAVNPGDALAAIDRHPLYRAFFRRVWYRSLRAKQQVFPNFYDFAPMAKLRRIQDMTNWILERHGIWKDAYEYYAGYTVTPEMLALLRTPTTIIAARNDAIIPIEGIARLKPHENLQIKLQTTGGHMGFVDVFPYRRWLPGAVLMQLEQGARHP